VQKIDSTTKSSQQQDEMREKISYRMGKIKHKLIIISGKGGVGKSMKDENFSEGPT
jgi:Mrp family chromosome partitioning ATPase